MLCEECHAKEAVYAVSVMVNGEITVRHLCPDCMERMNNSLQSGDIKNLLSSLLSAITGTSVPDKAEPDLVCPRCQTTLSQFRKTGHLGCPTCYETFQEQIRPMLQQIHGHVQHAGRVPLVTREAQAKRLQQEKLTRELEQAVAQEDFETAARLRDQLRGSMEEGADT